MSDGREDVCGDSYDHDLDLIDERDGYCSYVCRTCGAEILTEPEPEDEVSR
jgi:hypothetical protein